MIGSSLRGALALATRLVRGAVHRVAGSGGDFPHYHGREYRAWVARHDTLGDPGREALRRRLAALRRPPLISIAMATYETPERFLREAIASVRAQLYPHWELCVTDDASTAPHVRAILAEAAGEERRIKVTYRPTRGHISAALNSALALASGEFVAFLDHDDVLPETALAEVALELERHPDAELVYSDEDKLDLRGRRCEPHFKPDWNPELLESINYIAHLAALRRELVERVGGLREGFEGSQDYDLLLRATAAIADPQQIRHIPRVLYHWRRHWRSTALRQASKSYAFEAAKRSLAEIHRGEGVEVLDGDVPGTHHLRYPIESRPLVSVIVVARSDGLGPEVERLATTTYDHHEVVLAEGGKGGAEALNRAAREANGEVLAFLDDDLDAVTADWLEEMLGHAVRPGIGAVGAKLLSARGRVEHGGIALGIGGIAGRPHRGFAGRDHGYFSRLGCTQAVSAVAAACMVTRRDAFEAAGGFDVENLATAFTDVDLCLRLRELGYRNVWTPHAVLRRRKTSRDADLAPSPQSCVTNDAAYMKRRWGAALLADPYYNPNLTLDSERVYVARVPRTPAGEPARQAA